MKRLLWAVEKQFDVATDASTWVEMIRELEKRYQTVLLTGYRNKPVDTLFRSTRCGWYRSARIPIVNRLVSYFYLVALLMGELRRNRPDFVILNGTNPFLVLAAARARRMGARVIFDVRTLPVGTSAASRLVENVLLGLCLKLATRVLDGVSYITEEMEEHCRTAYGLGDHCSTTWSSGVNPDIFQISTSGPVEHAEMTVLYHGTIACQRRLGTVVEALALLPQGLVRLRFLGSGDGTEDIRQLIESLGLHDYVRVDPPIPYERIPEAIAACDLGIIPLPNWQGWNVSSPIKLFEYLACGKPVIVTDIPAHRAVLDGMPFAFWAGNGSPPEIAAAMTASITARSALPGLGLAARDFVSQRYTWACQADRLALFLENLPSAGRG
ncbi:glycosyltransferase [Desulfobulbus sp.]|uniref:glycosyltransferase n=1 Tax=Desulfobulbus sp. TaxID=895 RepID=UPI0027BAB236|nr:glycosyltransferase [Desulfobulbus sp.]